MRNGQYHTEASSIYEETNKNLANEYQNGRKECFAKLIEFNRRLIKKVSKTMHNYFTSCGVPTLTPEDFEHECMLGVVDAAEHYDEKRGKFSTYLYKCMKNHIWIANMDEARTVRIPREMQGDLRKMRKNGDERYDEIIETFLHQRIDIEDVEYLLESNSSPDEHLLSKELKDAVREEIGKLPPDERTFMCLYVYDDMNIREIGDAFGKGKAAISLRYISA